MDFKTSKDFVKDADTVLAAYADEAYHQAKLEKLGARNVSASVTDNGDSFTIVLKREEKSDVDVPGFAKKFVKEWNAVTSTDTWNKASKSATSKIEVDGAPIDISAEISLADGASGATQNISWTLKCGIPLVGGKLEKMTAEDVKIKAENDKVATNEVLASR